MNASVGSTITHVVLLVVAGGWPSLGYGSPLQQVDPSPDEQRAPEAKPSAQLSEAASSPEAGNKPADAGEPQTRTLSPPAEDQPERAPERSPYGGNFGGTFAYDPQVGYDYGQSDDNGNDAYYYKNSRGSGPRLPGKRPDPGDWDFFDAYQQGIIYNDRSLGDYDDLGGYREFHGGVGRGRYWRTRGFIPLRYDDFREYQRFHYELGGQP